jgi:hypothetical protein
MHSLTQAISDLLRSVTSLPGDTTLLTLLPGPLLHFVCEVAEKDLSATWSSQAGRLILQLNPPTFSSLKPTPSLGSLKLLDYLAPVLIRSSLNVLASQGGEFPSVIIRSVAVALQIFKIQT